MREDAKPGDRSESRSSGCQGLMWWATLVVAVLAVPSFGFVISRLIPVKGIGEILVFIGACWFCTYLGIKLMHNPQMSKKIGGDKNP